MAFVNDNLQNNLQQSFNNNFGLNINNTNSFV
jgi:hypothetical protein